MNQKNKFVKVFIIVAKLLIHIFYLLFSEYHLNMITNIYLPFPCNDMYKILSTKLELGE